MKSIYLAGPIQHADGHGRVWRDRVTDEYSSVANWINPFDEVDAVEDEWTAEYIVEKDLEMIDNSDALLVNWQEVPMCGSPMEIRYAYDNSIPVHVFTSIGCENLSPWLVYHSTNISRTLEDAIDALDI